MPTGRVIQWHFDRASRQWKRLQLLRHSATLGIVVISVALLLGIAIACGWLANIGFATACFVLLAAGAILALALLSLIVATFDPERDELARGIERAHPMLMDRLNTLVFLEGLKQTPRVRSYHRRIEAQARAALAEQVPTAPFSSARALVRFCVLAALVLITTWFYLQFRPLLALTIAGSRQDGEAQLAEVFEMPPAEPEPEAVEEPAPWGHVRITDPGRDLTVT